MLSVIIPSYKDPYLHKTVQSILDNFQGEFEVICVLDGYWTEIINDPRVRCIHLGKNRGMRDAINAGVSIARGEYLMRTDEHCMFAPGFDTTILKDIKDNEIVTAKRYFLDPIKWEIMKEHEPVIYEKLAVQSIGDGKKFCGVFWRERDQERKDIMIDETQSMQGSCWVMSRKWWDSVIKKLQTEGYGPLLQDSHEMVFKTWQAGGKLMINKNTWFAHKHVSFSRTHQYGGPEAEKCVLYSFNTWKDYYKEFKKQWENDNR